MNQDFNNMNQNNFNWQNNNNLSNNQSSLDSNNIQQQINNNLPPMQSYNISQNNKKKKNTGLIIGIIIAIVIALIAGVFGVRLVLTKISSSINSKNSTFYADGYNLKYNLKWSKTTVSMSDGSSKDALMFGYKTAYLIPVGNSALSDFESDYDVDFNTDEGKKELYDQFYSYWNKGNTKLFDGSNGFSLLTDDIYYATMDYGLSKNDLKGKMYLIVKKDNNIVISLMSNIESDFDKNSKEILDILKTINIEKKYDDELSDALSSMSAWNMYSNVRQEKLGKKKNIDGGWRMLSDSESYWVFKNNEFWWYKSYNDLNDNYWYGKTKILIGKTGLKQVGLSEDRIDYITANAGGKVTENDIYTIIFTPSKVISGGIDKSSTNITGEDWHMVWIIVDHGSEGIEAQVLNVKTYETSYLVKISD